MIRGLLIHDDTGASAVEYGLIVAGIAAVVVATVFALGGVTFSLFSESCSEMDTFVSTATC